MGILLGILCPLSVGGEFSLSPQWRSSEPSPQSLTPLQMTPPGPAGTQRPFSQRNSLSLHGLGVMGDREGTGVDSQWYPTQGHRGADYV